VIITKLGRALLRGHAGGLLAWNGSRPAAHRRQGTVIIQNTFFIGFANDFLPSATAWILAVAGIVLYAAMLFWQRAQRARGRGSSAPRTRPAPAHRRVRHRRPWRSAYVCDQDRGIPYVMLVIAGLFIFWTYVLDRTRFGRTVYAVGGNAEAARRGPASTSTTSRWRASPSAR
jgi:D-xylose transport system permease protein